MAHKHEMKLAIIRKRRKIFCYIIVTEIYCLAYLRVSVIPVQLIAENILSAMSGFAPLERYFGLPDLDRRKHFGLTRYPLLCFDLHWHTERSRTDARECLDSYGIDSVWRQLRDGCQLAVIHHLVLPRCHRLIRIRCIIHFVSLKDIMCSLANSLQSGEK